MRTKERWRASGRGSVVLVDGPAFKMVAAVYGDNEDCIPDDKMRANAALIAAAQDLLEALQVCLKAEKERRKKLLPNAPATTYTESRIRLIEAAIAKATTPINDSDIPF